MKFIASLLFVLMAFIAVSAKAELVIDITQGHSDPMPVAITDFTGDSAMGRNISGVISANLERSGLFRPINPGAFIENIVDGNAAPRFADWRQINAQGLVTGTVSGSGGRLTITFRLWDVFGEQQVAGKEFSTTAANWRRISHIISDEIYKRLTGEEGYFDSRIVYVAESGPLLNRLKRLAIMDQDGENHKFLSDGRSMVLTPRFSPNAQEILYMSYAAGAPKVFIRNLQTGREEVLGNFPGMSFAPRFSPSGGQAAMSIADNGNTDIFVMNLAARSLTRITADPGIDTSPSYSPDGSEIVFNSDRGGAQQLYIMGADGSNVRRISFGDGRYGTPVWSPRGDFIAFTKMKGGVFYIGVMRPDGSGERMLTSDFLAEGPTWSPNGRVIIYTRQGRGGLSRLMSVDLTGVNERQVVTPTDASDPSWSPLLPM
jgi:TolB protein